MTSVRYRSFFWTYLAFLGLTVVVGLVAYGISYTTVRDVALTAGRQDLEYAVDNVRSNLSGSFDSVAHLITSPTLQALARADRPLALSHYLPLVELHRTLSSFAIAGGFAEQVAVVLFRPQLYVSSNQIATDLPWYYEHFMRHEGVSFEAWLRLVRGDPHHTRAVLGMYDLRPAASSAREVLLLQSIPIGSARPVGTVILHVPEDRFFAPIKGRLVHHDSFAILTGRDRSVIARVGNQRAAMDFLERNDTALINPKRDTDGGLVVIRSADDLLGLEFVVGLPRAQLYRRVSVIGIVFMGILLAELIGGVALASYLANRNIKPLRAILSDVPAQPPTAPIGRTDEYELIGRTLTLLARDNRKLSRIVEAQAPLLASSFIEHLLSGKIADTRTLESACEIAGVRFAHPLYVVCLLSLHNDSGSSGTATRPIGQSTVETAIAEQWRAMLPYDAYSYRAEHGTAAFIHNIPATAAERFPERLRAATERLTSNLADTRVMRVAVACSRWADTPLSIAARYTEAKSLHDYQVTFGLSGIRFADDETAASRHVVFGLDQETALSRHVLSGNTDATEALLDAMLREVVDDPNPSETYASLLLRQVEGALLRLVESRTFRDTPAGETVRELARRGTAGEAFAERFAELQGCCMRLCEAVRSQRGERDARLFSSMISFIETHRSDPQLNLSGLADEFGLSAGHVSRYFKQHAGTGFADYLEHSRIAEAARLLEQTDIAVAEIARRVGYLNTNTFYKAFRRSEGESAGAYRRRVMLGRHPADDG